MIVELRGTYRGRAAEGVVLDANGVGYEVLLPPVVLQSLGELAEGSPLQLKIAYIATRDQPIPVLFGFLREEERDFWGLLKSVPRVGPKGAARAMVLPVSRIAQAIVDQNTRLIDSLPGISADGAQKIVASLKKKAQAFAAIDDEMGSPPSSRDDLTRLAVELLVEMGIRRLDAVRDVRRLLDDRPDLAAVEDVVVEYFRK